MSNHQHGHPNSPETGTTNKPSQEQVKGNTNVGLDTSNPHVSRQSTFHVLKTRCQKDDQQAQDKTRRKPKSRKG